MSSEATALKSKKRIIVNVTCNRTKAHACVDVGVQGWCFGWLSQIACLGSETGCGWLFNLPSCRIIIGLGTHSASVAGTVMLLVAVESLSYAYGRQKAL